MYLNLPRMDSAYPRLANKGPQRLRFQQHPLNNVLGDVPASVLLPLIVLAALCLKRRIRQGPLLVTLFACMVHSFGRIVAP